MAKTWTVGLTHPSRHRHKPQEPMSCLGGVGRRGLEAAKEHETDVSLAACCKRGKRSTAAVPASLSCRFGDGGSGWPVRVAETG